MAKEAVLTGEWHANAVAEMLEPVATLTAQIGRRGAGAGQEVMAGDGPPVAGAAAADHSAADRPFDAASQGEGDAPHPPAGTFSPQAGRWEYAAPQAAASRDDGYTGFVPTGKGGE
ncbi:MAG TPA: hypothetical protein VM468_16840, partial [Mycoplana sp.]|nr:hypothetical protein [Mycoplana sp.]